MGGTTLVAILLLLGVEIELRGVAVFVGYVVGLERSGIVATHLIDTGAEGSGTVVVAHDDVGVGREATLEVRAYGGNEDEEQIVVGGMHAYARRGADEQRADIESGAALIGGDILLVEAYHAFNHLYKELGGNLGHHDAAAGTLQAGCILFHAEYAHLAVGTAVGFQTLKGFLSVVQAGSCE